MADPKKPEVDINGLDEEDLHAKRARLRARNDELRRRIEEFDLVLVGKVLYKKSTGKICRPRDEYAGSALSLRAAMGIPEEGQRCVTARDASLVCQFEDYQVRLVLVTEQD